MSTYSRKISLNEVVIASAVRTPIGSFKGGLHSISATKLGAVAVKAAVERSGIPKEVINEAFIGNVCSANIGQAPARQAVIFAGLPNTVICTTINKLCASGMKSIIQATQSLQTGTNDVALAGGMESMSNVPYYLNRGEIPYGGCHITDGIILDAFTDVYTKLHAGNCAENTAKKYNISRIEQDDYAILSYKRSAAAYEVKAFSDEIIPVPVLSNNGIITTIVSEDEEYKRANVDKIRKLPTAFQNLNGTVTAGNASTLGDGAAALVLLTAGAAKRLDVHPLAKIIGYSEVECEPTEFPTAPSIAIPKLLEQTGVIKDDVALWEINEAFSAVAIANQKILNIDIDKLNIHGGAVSLGHPLAMSGSRIVTHLVHALRKGEIGVAAICNGGGGASSIMIEKM